MRNPVKFWNRVSRLPAGMVASLEESQAATVAAIRDHLAGDEQVLDLGCGNGAIPNALAGDARHIHALDTSAGMIEVAKAQAARRNIENVSFVTTNIFEWGRTPGTVDVVLACNVLQYVDEIQGVLKRIHELLKPDGLFISMTACLGERKTVLSLFMRILTKTRVVPRLAFLTVDDVDALARDAGFDLVRSQDLTPVPEHFLVARKS